MDGAVAMGIVVLLMGLACVHNYETVIAKQQEEISTLREENSHLRANIENVKEKEPE